MLTRDIEMYKVATACQKKASWAFAGSKQQTQEAVSYHTAFLVYTFLYPYYINDTACVLDGVIPTLSLLPEVAKSNIHAVFVFVARNKTDFQSKFKQQEVVMNNAISASAVPQVSQSNPYAFPEEHPYYLVTLKNPTVSISITKKDCSDQYGRYVDFKTGIFFKVNPDNSIDLSDFQSTK